MRFQEQLRHIVAAEGWYAVFELEDSYLLERIALWSIQDRKDRSPAKHPDWEEVVGLMADETVESVDTAANFVRYVHEADIRGIARRLYGDKPLRFTGPNAVLVGKANAAIDEQD